MLNANTSIIQNKIADIINITQCTGLRLYNFISWSIIYKKKKCYCNFRGKYVPLYKIYRLELDCTNNIIMVYAIYFIFIKRKIFEIRPKKENDVDAYLHEYSRKILQAVRGV